MTDIKKLFCVTAFLAPTLYSLKNLTKIYSHITDDFAEDAMKAVTIGGVFYLSQSPSLTLVSYIPIDIAADWVASHRSLDGSKQDNTSPLINDTSVNEIAKTTECEGVFKQYARMLVSDIVEDGAKVVLTLGAYYCGEIGITNVYTEAVTNVLPNIAPTIMKIITPLILGPTLIQYYAEINDRADLYGDYVADFLMPATNCTTELS